MNYYSSSSSNNSRPDKPLVIKCEFNTKTKKVSFKSARNCSFDGLKEKIQQGFSLSAHQFALKWTDDDGEEIFICSDSDLDDAIHFHQGSDDAPASSGSSVFSSRTSRNKITLSVEVRVDYDGPSLSDSSSLSSREELEERDGNHYDFSSTGPPHPLDDDERTVSSRDTNGGSRGSSKSDMLRRLFDSSSRSHGSSQSRTQRQLKMSTSRLFSLPSRSKEDPFVDGIDDDASTTLGTDFPNAVNESVLSTDSRAIFAQLKKEKRQEVPSIEPWLRDQSNRTLGAMLRVVPGTSDADTFSLNTDTPFSDGEGPFADIFVETNSRGEKRYTYRSSASEVSRDLNDFDVHVQQGRLFRNPRPFSSATLSSESGDVPSSGYPTSSHQSSRHLSISHSTSDPGPPPTDNFPIPPELLIPDEVTDCSECGAILESIRYICTTCGDKPSVRRAELVKRLPDEGKSSGYSMHDYTPHPHRSGSSSYASSDTSRTLVESHPLQLSSHGDSFPHYRTGTLSDMSQSSSSSTTSARAGYELCSMCCQTKGVNHSLFGDMINGLHGNLNNPFDPQGLAVARRTAPRQKGQLRHAYAEKLWGPDGWQDLEQMSSERLQCSGCQTRLHTGRYKCAVCDDYALCRACYSDVHNVHPLHAFLVTPDQSMYSKSLPNLPIHDENTDERSLTHIDFQCYHCKRGIIGARFHCITCISVDICSSCETAGLPGDMDAAHTPSHVLIKFPMPLNAVEEQAVTKSVRLLASNDHNGLHRSSPSSISSSLAQTVQREEAGVVDHHILCNSCNESIVGIRYQCVSCPSKHSVFNLCKNCEVKSHLVHNPKHIFVMLHRPVDDPRPLQSETPLISLDLYNEPVGSGFENDRDPEAYLKNLTHSVTYCDRHMNQIIGRWYRCACCEGLSTDLCSECVGIDGQNDGHDPTHAFIVFKAPVNMTQFRLFANIDGDDSRSPAVITGPIYYP